MNAPEKTVDPMPRIVSEQQFTRAAKSLTHAVKGAAGIAGMYLGALGIAAASPFAVIAGLGALYGGGRMIYEAARDGLPEKMQNAISGFFTGQNVAPTTTGEETPVKRGLRAAGNAGMLATGALSAVSGVYLALFVSFLDPLVAGLVYGGLFAGAAGAAGLAKDAVKGVKALLTPKQTDGKAGPAATETPETALSSTLGEKAAAPGFNAAAAPEQSAKPRAPRPQPPPEQRR